MATTYSFLLERRNPDNTVIKNIASILDNGYTYTDIRNAIFRAFHSHTSFPFEDFKYKVSRNLLRQGVRYYHKELILMNQLKPVVHDVDTGNITNSQDEFWVEPRASYTMEDLLHYFYSQNMCDPNQYPPNRMKSIFWQFINSKGLDVTLFMLEHSISLYHSDKLPFDYRRFGDYQSFGLQYQENCKNNCSYSGGANYVLRKRVLFD